MKKVFNYLRSMRFGILLLLLIAACSVAGTLIPQGREVAWYAQNYGAGHGVILLLGLNRIFQSWYFIALMALLCLNLTLCSLLRVRALAKSGRFGGEAAARLPNTLSLDAAGLEAVHAHLRALHCREERFGEATVYTKNAVGRWGTFMTHLAILLTVVFGAVALYSPTVTDQSCMPGESIFLPDGTEIRVLDFRIADETGRLDYQSHVQLTLPNGRRSESAALKVNHPFRFGPYKLFQQSFGTAGSITVTDLATGGSDTFLLTDMSFLTVDSLNGVVYEQLYPDYLRAPNGEVTLFTVTEGSYPNPIYALQVISDGMYTPTLAVPGDSLEVLGLRYDFNAPVDYPGLRIKRTPPLANALLVAAFTLMILGLFVTFFMEPVLVKVDAEGCAVGGPKPERLRLELEESTAPDRKEPSA